MPPFIRPYYLQLRHKSLGGALEGPHICWLNSQSVCFVISRTVLLCILGCQCWYCPCLVQTMFILLHNVKGFFLLMFQHVFLLLLLFCLCQVGSVQLFINSHRGSSGSINSFNGVCTVKYRPTPHTSVQTEKAEVSVKFFFRQSKRPALITAARSDSA